VACGKGQSEVKPPEIHYGETECIQCRMIISDARFAAGYTYAVSEGRYESVPFDDIGGMLIYASKHPEHQIAAFWVHDFTTEEWIRAQDAFYVFSQHLETPMAFGTAALETREKAEELAAEYHGELLDWDGLLARHHAGELVASLAGEVVDFPVPSGPDLGNWELAATFSDPANDVEGEASIPVEVALSKLIGTFVAADDESKLFLMVVSPQEAGIGLQPIEILALKQKSPFEWTPVDDLTLEIIPEMPTMGHGSPNNENPTLIGNGRYQGKVNFTMIGYWTVKVRASRDGIEIGELVFDYDVN